MMSLLLLAPTSAFVTPALRLAGAPARVHLSHMAPSITISMQSNSEEKGRAPLLSLSSKLLQQVQLDRNELTVYELNYIQYLTTTTFIIPSQESYAAGAEEHAASEGTAVKELWHRRTSQGARATCPPSYFIRTYIHTHTHTHTHKLCSKVPYQEYNTMPNKEQQKN